MPRANEALQTFNHGIVSRLALARTDIKRTGLSAAQQNNWMPRVLGSMMLRPGWQYLSSTLNNAKAYHLPFVRQFDATTDDTALIELTDQNVRVRVNDVPITRVPVSTVVTNGNFDADISGWTTADEAGCLSSWASPGFLKMVGAQYNAAKIFQIVHVAAADYGVQHALRIEITRGPVTFSVGATAAGDEYISSTTLGAGFHSLAFTPTGDFYINLSSHNQYAVLIESINIAASGEMNLPAPWVEADISKVRFIQSADVIYLACEGYQQRKIERRGTYSWSLVLLQTADGPFGLDNITSIRLTPSVLTGDGALSSDQNYFKSTDVGALYRITSTGQVVSLSATGDGQFTDPVRVSGVGTGRDLFIDISNVWTGTVRLQRSIGDTTSFVDVTSYTGNQAALKFNDAFDNQIIYYRLGFETGDYGSGTADLKLTYASDGLTGIARVTAYNSPKSVDIQVLVPFGNTTASELWAAGEWSDRRGWPGAVVLDSGRLWFAGNSKIWGSVSDIYESFDDTVVGDSAPINRTFGTGATDKVNWLLGLNRLIAGTASAEWNCRSSSLDEPLTTSNFNTKAPSTQGSAPVDALKIDDRGVFVHRGGAKLYQLDATGDYVFANYHSSDLSELTPDLCAAGIVRIGVQRQVDTRIHCVLADGTAAILISQPSENVLCWITVSTDGVIEDVVILPGIIEDRVYYVVKRTINGITKRYLEKWALESECQGGQLNKQADGFVIYSGIATNIITGLDHLEGKKVVVWGDYKDIGGANRTTFLVTGGAITLPNSVTVSHAVIGLGYEARYKSSKLAYAAGEGTALTRKKKVDHLGLILASTHAQGLRFGADFDLDTDGNYAHLDDMPMDEIDLEIDVFGVDEEQAEGLESGGGIELEAGGLLTLEASIPGADYIWDEYDYLPEEFPGDWDTDSRICLLAQAPRPCTVMAAIVGINTNG